MTNNANITVIFADKSIKSFYVEPKKSVLAFRKTVADSIKIEDDRYFGFYIQDDLKNIYWLSDEKNVFHYDFMKCNNVKAVLYFAFKYFYQFDYWLADYTTKNLCYWQLKKQLYDGDFGCDTDQCFKLLAMTLLLNDDRTYSYEGIKKMNIIPANLFAKHPSIDYCIDQIIIRYHEMESISKLELLKRFIVDVLEIPFLLTHFFIAKNFNSSNIVIGINQNGVFESDKCNKSSLKLSYGWSEISNISYNKSRISIDIQDSSHRSSLRRKSTALSISYELSNQNLAKSFISLAKDTVNFISQTPYTRVMSSTTPRRNPNNIKKAICNTYSGNKEKNRPSTQNTFISENDIAISRSSSRVSLASSNYAGSAITNDSASLLLDDDSVGPINVPEKHKIFLKLNDHRKQIIQELNSKIKEAVQNCILEKTITKNMPGDLNILDPKGQIKLTKFTLTQCAGGEISLFQSKKNAILEEIETLQNIVDKLKENERKHRIEIKKKEEQIRHNIQRIKDLENSNALEIYKSASRSNSEGCLFPIPNGDIPNFHNGYDSQSNEPAAPLTEPRSRKNAVIYSERSTSGSETLRPFKHQYSRMKSSEEQYLSTSTSTSSSPLRLSDIKNFDHNNTPPTSNYSQFHRFASNRSQIKGSQARFNITFIQKKSFETNSNSSVDSSNSSVEIPDQEAAVVAAPYLSSNSNSDNENTQDQIVPMRSYTSPSHQTNQAARDSREINMNRAKLNYKVSNMKIQSRIKKAANHNQNQNRNSVSLEELREDGSDVSEASNYYAIRHHRESNESTRSGNSKLTYHPSKKDGRPINLTRGKQPSIIRKAARTIVGPDKML